MTKFRIFSNLFGVLCLSFCFQALADHHGVKTTTKAKIESTKQNSLEQLVATSNSIIVARVLPHKANSQSSEASNDAQDLEKLRQRDEKKAREGRSKPLSGFFTGGMQRVETVAVLKGPQTASVMVPAKLSHETEALVENALYVIFLGSTHEKARVMVVSEYDPWVEKVTALIGA